VLNPGRKSDMGESTAVHGVEVLVHGVVPRTDAAGLAAAAPVTAAR